MTKLKPKDNEEARRIMATVDRCVKEVASWPPWKRGDDEPRREHRVVQPGETWRGYTNTGSLPVELSGPAENGAEALGVKQKLQLDVSQPDARRVWETIQRCKREVAQWPAWKRGEDVKTEDDNGPKEYRCTLCGAVYSLQSALDAHTNKRHGGTASAVLCEIDKIVTDIGDEDTDLPECVRIAVDRMEAAEAQLAAVRDWLFNEE